MDPFAYVDDSLISLTSRQESLSSGAPSPGREKALLSISPPCLPLSLPPACFLYPRPATSPSFPAALPGACVLGNLPCCLLTCCGPPLQPPLISRVKPISQ
ncbi:hypothetical protein AAFF_G00013420 [Aldrovandia affinis]|uniref:Uncharacterized protein n=1 Tax=Aldrovandia affinis TaxID=143900 RepID=A0AAD7R2V0_9TELE|nr:hypothetical protein AAFF_G00013420 [Aldrovandia affinis]